MPNRRLSDEERKQSDAALETVRRSLANLSSGDRELLFAHRRRLIVRLTHDERDTPAKRNKLKAIKRREQNGLCAACSEPLPEKYVELDRCRASDGYTVENTRLLHHRCHIEDQARKAYT